MGLKTRLAFQWSVEDMCDQVFFWTFTFAEVTGVKDCARKWHRFINGSTGLYEAFPTMSGLRVFEKHPGKPTPSGNPTEDGTMFLSHGWHVHMVVNEYLPVDIVRIVAAKHGFGRINVKQIPRKAAGYLAKYLSKERAESAEGVRLWGAVGRLETHKVRDIRVSSPFVDAHRLLAMVVRGFQNLPWHQQIQVSQHVMYGGSVSDCIDILPPREERYTQEDQEAIWAAIMESIDKTAD